MKQNSTRYDHSRTSPASRLLRRCGCRAGRPKCRDCERKGQLRRHGPGRHEGPAPAIVHEVLAEAGRPLEGAARQAMEAGFGADFSRVRVHTDGRAQRSADAIGARAYAAGPHLVFGPGAYAPHTAAGRELLAHELAHVLQNQDRPAGSLWVGAPHDPAEREAETLARIVATGGRVAVVARGSADGALRRAPKGPDSRLANTTWSATISGAKVMLKIVWIAEGGPEGAYVGTITSPTCNGTFKGWLSYNSLTGTFDCIKDGKPLKDKMYGYIDKDKFQILSNYVLGVPVGTYTLQAAVAAPPPPPPAKKVCGPDVTIALEETLKRLESDFSQMQPYVKAAKCNRIVQIMKDESGGSAIKSSWEISELVEQKWWPNAKLAGCSDPANPKEHREACNLSVQVGNVCQNVYTPNYALFGTMCRLCFDESVRLGGDFGGINIRQSELGMQALIFGYSNTAKRSDGRYIPFIDPHQLEWAKLAHQNRGWRRGMGTPDSDYYCETSCSQKFTKPLAYRWEPIDVPPPPPPAKQFDNIRGQTAANDYSITINRTPDKQHAGTLVGKNYRGTFTGDFESNVMKGDIVISGALAGGRSIRGTMTLIVKGATLTILISPPGLMRYFSPSGNPLTFTITGKATN